MTTHARPEGSWESACRHFFRHVDEPRELRRNPIAAPFFLPNVTDRSVVDSVRQAILAALEQYELDAFTRGRYEDARRRRAVISSHILERLPATFVAAKLSVSRRQFYRERRAICTWIGRRIEASNIGVLRPAMSVGLEADEIALSRALRMLEAPRPDEGFLLLEDIASGVADPQHKVKALSLEARGWARQLEYEKAERSIAAARVYVSEHDGMLPEANARACQLRIDLSEAFLAVQRYPRDEARLLFDKVLHKLDKLHGLPAVRDLRADTLLFAAEQAFCAGRFDKFRKHLASAEAEVSSLPSASSLQKATLYMLVGFLGQVSGAGCNFADSSRMFAAAHLLAQKDGLFQTRISLQLLMAGCYSYGLGDLATAKSIALPAFHAGLHSRNPVVIGYVSIDAAAIHNISGQFNRALRLAEYALKHGRCYPFNKGLLLYEAAQAALGAKRWQRSASYAEAAIKLAKRLDNGRLEGAALRTLALANHCRGQSKVARAEIIEALDLGQRFGNLLSLALTYFASSVITGHREHERLAWDSSPWMCRFMQRILPPPRVGA